MSTKCYLFAAGLKDRCLLPVTWEGRESAREHTASRFYTGETHVAQILPCQALNRPLQTQGPLEPESQICGIRKDLRDFKQILTLQREAKRLNGAGAPEPATWMFFQALSAAETPGLQGLLRWQIVW